MVDVIQSTNASVGSASSTTLTFGSAVTAGSTLVAITRYGSADNYTSVTDSVNSGNYTEQVDVADSPGDHLYASYFKNTGAGTPTVTITFSAAASIRWGILECGPCDTSAPLDQSNSLSGFSASPASGNITTVNANDLLIAFAEVSGTETFTDDATFTNVFNVVSKLDVSKRIVSATGTYSSTWSISSVDDWAAGIIALKAAGAVALPPWFDMVSGGDIPRKTNEPLPY